MTTVMKWAGLALVGSLVLGTGVASAHDHPGGADQGSHHVIRGVFEGGSLTGSVITLQTADGRRVTVEVTPQTRIALEAQGTVAAIQAALNAHRLALTVEGSAKSSVWVATAIEAHLTGLGENVGHHDHSGGDHHGGDHHGSDAGSSADH